MRIPVTCPNCQKHGTLPEAMRGQRVTCARCHQPFVVAAPKSGPKPSTGVLAAMLDENVSVRRLPDLPSTGPRRAAYREAPGPNPSTVYAAIAGVCAVIVVVVITFGVVWSRPGAETNFAKREPEPDTNDGAQHSGRFSQPPPPPEQTQPHHSTPDSAELQAQRRKAIEDATVYLKLSRQGRLIGGGTGFVIGVEQDAVILATNRHVADAETDDGGKADIMGVFRSGQGPALEESLPAEIVAIDHSRELNHDLAVLRVRGLKKAVKPINPAVLTVPALQMKYSVYGFPYADLLNLNRGNPTITVSGGTISSLKNDDHGQLVSLQLDGALHPGNSGGPLVDEQGRLLGVAVAKLEGANIGFAIPAADLRAVLAGRMGLMKLFNMTENSQTPELQVKVQLVDPNRRIKSVKVLIAPAQGRTAVAPRADGSWPALEGAKSADLSLENSMAKGQIQVALGQNGPDARKVMVQISHVDLAGKTILSPPRLLNVPVQKGPFSDGLRIEELRHQLEGKSLAKLGPLVEKAESKDENECSLSKDPEKHQVSISIPANRAFSLSPKVQTQGRKPVHNAPRTLTEIEGDFVAFVEVSGDINPGLDAIKDPRGRNLGICHQSAGILIYQDKDNFLRLERACRAQGVIQYRELLVEVVRHGEEKAYAYIPLPGEPKAPMILFVVRHGDKFTCLFSFDEGQSLGIFQDFTLDYPSKVKVGLCASNLSKKPFTAKFESFVLVDDKTTVQEEFGN